MHMDANPDTIVDYITGRSIPNIGAEANRQKVERFLVEEKGYRKDEVQVDAPIAVAIGDEVYRSTVDLVVSIGDFPVIAIKCAAGSLGSREREIISAARLYGKTPLPLAVVSDGNTAMVLDVMTGKKKGDGLNSIPDRDAATALTEAAPLPAMAGKRLVRERLIFRSYDSMNVNIQPGAR
jgi:hypothetical protein